MSKTVLNTHMYFMVWVKPWIRAQSCVKQRYVHDGNELSGYRISVQNCVKHRCVRDLDGLNQAYTFKTVLNTKIVRH